MIRLAAQNTILFKSGALAYNPSLNEHSSRIKRATILTCVYIYERNGVMNRHAIDFCHGNDPISIPS